MLSRITLDLVGADRSCGWSPRPGEILLGLFHPGARRRAHVQAHLAGIDLGEEIAPQLREQQQRAAIRREEPIARAATLDRQAPMRTRRDSFAEALEPVLESEMHAPEQMFGAGAAGAAAGTAAWPPGRAPRWSSASGIEQHRHQVKDSTRLASSETHTETDSGENRYLAVPCSRNTGTNTMQMHSVERNVGTPTSPQPLTMASSGSRPADVALDVLDHDRAVVHQDADRQGEAAERHGVECLATDYITSTAVMIDSGMAARMMTVRRQLPRNSRIISAVRPAAIAPPISTLFSAALTKID